MTPLINALSLDPSLATLRPPTRVVEAIHGLLAQREDPARCDLHETQELIRLIFAEPNRSGMGTELTRDQRAAAIDYYTRLSRRLADARPALQKVG